MKKAPYKNRFWPSNSGLKKIQTAVYNGAHTVFQDQYSNSPSKSIVINKQKPFAEGFCLFFKDIFE